MTYTAGYNAPVAADLARRTAAGHAAFFLPHLHRHMALLDVGCGPGSITLDLAGVVDAGTVVGVDVSPWLVGRARIAAGERGVVTARFAAASVLELPFGDGSFDAVFAHALLEHLADPPAALRELHRVLRPGGVIGVRDADHGGVLLTPLTPELEHSLRLWDQLWRENRGDPHLGRSHRRLLREAGFRDASASASYDYCGVGQDTKAFADLMAYELGASDNAGRLVALGWADRPTLERLASAWHAWGAHPDAFFARPRCEAVAWKP
jgi:ubiquinone/menaquinone biosynthesis C-methylase UbiE